MTLRDRNMEHCW